MLVSMTGFGEAHSQSEGLAIVVEVRSVNNRHFKFSYRSSDGYGALETAVEELIRKQIRRGSVQLNLRIDQENPNYDYRINADVLEAYRWQLDAFKGRIGTNETVALDTLLTLPGVIVERQQSQRDPMEDWPAIEPVVQQALSLLLKMRAEEGKALAEDLVNQCRIVLAHLKKINERAPAVVTDYRNRLADRVNKLLAEFEVTVTPADLIREVSLFVDRSDITEEVVRLQSHVQQFDKATRLTESAGRKLEFITQEMGREVNTIGSKANDPQISQHVVEMKTALERIREQVQNVE